MCAGKRVVGRNVCGSDPSPKKKVVVLTSQMLRKKPTALSFLMKLWAFFTLFAQTEQEKATAVQSLMNVITVPRNNVIAVFC